MPYTNLDRLHDLLEREGLVEDDVRNGQHGFELVEYARGRQYEDKKFVYLHRPSGDEFTVFRAR